MAQRPTADYPIDANTTSGTDLSLILNRFQTALESGNSGSSRPAYITAGGLWVKEGDPMELYLFDGTTDQLLYDTSNGINVTEGLWTLVDENNEAGEIQRPSDVLIDGNLTVTGDLVDGNGDPISIIDPATEDGVIATWSNTDGRWTPQSAVIVDSNTGNATFSGQLSVGAAQNGNSTYGGALKLSKYSSDGNTDTGIEWHVRGDGGGHGFRAINIDKGSGKANQWVLQRRSDSADWTDAIEVNGETGNATFSGKATAIASAEYGAGLASESLNAAGWARIDLSHKHSGVAMMFLDAEGQMCFRNDADKSTNFPGREGSYRFMDSIGNQVVIFTQQGDATFSGTVIVGNNGGTVRTTTHGIAMWSGGDGQVITPVDSSNVSTNGIVSLGDNTHRFKNCYLTGSVISTRHGTSIGTRDLIETLHTLRNATKDEETLEGLRDAIGDAIGGLIQKFEAIQAEAKEKLEEAYNQTGTQEITPDKGTKDDKPEAGTLDLEE